jgi:hypothetical protein
MLNLRNLYIFKSVATSVILKPTTTSETAPDGVTILCTEKTFIEGRIIVIGNEYGKGDLNKLIIF